MQPPCSLISHLDLDVCGVPIGYAEDAARAYPDETAASLLLAATHVMAVAYPREGAPDPRAVLTLRELKGQGADLTNRGVYSPAGGSRMLRLLAFVLHRELDYSPEARPHQALSADDTLPDLHDQVYRMASAASGLLRRAQSGGMSAFGATATLVHATLRAALESGLPPEELATVLAEALTSVASKTAV